MFNFTNIKVVDDKVNFDLILDDTILFNFESGSLFIDFGGDKSNYICGTGYSDSGSILLIPASYNYSDLCAFYLYLKEDLKNNAKFNKLQIINCSFYEFEAFETFLKEIKNHINKTSDLKKRICDLQGKELKI